MKSCHHNGVVLVLSQVVSVPPRAKGLSGPVYFMECGIVKAELHASLTIDRKLSLVPAFNRTTIRRSSVLYHNRYVDCYVLTHVRDLCNSRTRCGVFFSNSLHVSSST